MKNEKEFSQQPIIGIIGAGKLGTGLTEYWRLKGLGLAYCFSRTQAHAAEIAKQTGAIQTQTARELIDQCDWIWIAISDHAIQSFCEELAGTYGNSTGLCSKPLAGKLICHTSGALTSDVLNRLNDLGGACCSLHPLQAFSKKTASKEALEKTWFFVEGELSEQHWSWISDYFNQTGNPYRQIEKTAKPLYHAAACTASNYLVTLMEEAAQLLALCGDEIPFEALLPLVQGTLENYKESGFTALTGPISRGDASTVALHLKTMKSHSHDSQLYKLMGLETIKSMEKSRLLRGTMHRDVIETLESEEV